MTALLHAHHGQDPERDELVRDERSGAERGLECGGGGR